MKKLALIFYQGGRLRSVSDTGHSQIQQHPGIAFAMAGIPHGRIDIFETQFAIQVPGVVHGLQRLEVTS